MRLLSEDDQRERLCKQAHTTMDSAMTLNSFLEKHSATLVVWKVLTLLLRWQVALRLRSDGGDVVVMLSCRRLGN